MPYRQNAESLSQILEDAIEMAMSPTGSNRRADVQRMVDRIDHALALSAATPDAREDDVIQSLQQVRDVLTLKVSSGRHVAFELPAAVTAGDEADARASPRGVQLRIIQVTLNESAVVTAQIDVVRFAAQRRSLTEREREKLASAVALLRDRYESGQTSLRLATLEPCNALHAQLLNRKFDRLEDDLKRLLEIWQRGQRRLSRA